MTYKMLFGRSAFCRVSYKKLKDLMPLLLARLSESYEVTFYKLFGTVSYEQPTYSDGGELFDRGVDFIKQLLLFDPNVRLGGGMLYNARPAPSCPVRSHAFFHDVNWEEVEKAGAKPPYTPAEDSIDLQTVSAAITGSAMAGVRIRDAEGEGNVNAGGRVIHSGQCTSTLTDILVQTNKAYWTGSDESADDDLPEPLTKTTLSRMIDALRHPSFSSMTKSGPATVATARFSRERTISVLGARSGSSAATTAGSETSAITQAAERRRKFDVTDHDQAHFHGWNYVSHDAVECFGDCTPDQEVMADLTVLTSGKIATARSASTGMPTNTTNNTTFSATALSAS